MSKWTTNASECLIHVFESGEISNGKTALAKLLADHKMNGAWKVLARHVDDEVGF